MPKQRHIVVMGVTACGKSTVGAELATRLGLPFKDGDAFHPEANIAKMEAGTPLTDEDRWPWLTRIGEELGRSNGLVIACSALKRAYRDRIRKEAGRNVTFVHLTGSRDVLEARMGDRTGHFMPTSLLDSQLAALEPPQADEHAVSVSIDAPVPAVVERAVTELRAVNTE